MSIGLLSVKGEEPLLDPNPPNGCDLRSHELKKDKPLETMKPIIALAQHPMYLLIKEDSGCAERTPPWGAPDIETYIERLRQNILTLKKYPQLKIGYEWSALELEMLFQDAPEVFSEMLKLVKDGQCTFYNGTYSQPHLQTLSSESNFRQFEWGARIYKELCHHQVVVYAHQESSLNEQTPQLLKAFGIRYGVIPHFSSTLNMISGGEILFHSRYGTMFMHGEEFAEWKGLDGTIMDLYLEEPNHMRIRDWINFQEVLGLCHVPPVMVEIPDLIDVDDEWLEQRARAEFALLDNVLDERRKIFPPRFQTQFYTNWSYIEGIRAEELSRSNFKAEISAIRAEAINALAFGLLQRPVDFTDAAWKKILTTQHHDVYCFCAPELRGKSVISLLEAQAETNELTKIVAEEIISKIEFPSNSQMLVVFNTIPHSQTNIVTADIRGADPVVKDLLGDEIPTEIVDCGDGNTQVRFVAHLTGLGYSTYQIGSGGAIPTQEIVTAPFTFENNFYSAVIRPDGVFTSIRLQPTGVELLAGNSIPSNLLSARDSTGLGPTHEGTFDIAFSGWEKWEPSGRGPELYWQPSGAASIKKCLVGTTFVLNGTIGTSIKASLKINFYYALPRIDLDWIFDFDMASIGHFFDDETKLRVQWPLAFSGKISHDIPFGVVDTRDERPFFPANWTDISDGEKGLAYFHQGTSKHWVIGKTLFNLFAWGEYTDAIGNRLDMTRWPKCFDQRLNGRHTIHAAVLPHPGDWRFANLAGEARSYNMPPIAFAAQPHSGTLPTQRTLMAISDPEIASTSIKVVDDQIVTRLYSLKEKSVPVGMNVDNAQVAELKGLHGEKLDKIGPFQIAHLVINPIQGEV